MSIDSELKKISFAKKSVLALPILTGGLGGSLGHYTSQLARNYNQELNSLENNLQQIITAYRQTEEHFEAELDNIPGLNLWKSGYEKLFGETQQLVGISDQEFTKVKPDDISLQDLNLPNNYGTYPLVGLAIGLIYGIMKVKNKISKLSHEQKIFERLK